MPRKSGFEVLEWLRQPPPLKRLPVVVLTASSQGPDIDRAYALGANSYLVKPPDAKALRDMVERLNVCWIVTDKPQHSLAK